MKAAILIGQSQRGSPDFRPLEGVDNDLSDMHGFLRHVAGYDIVHEARDRSKADVLTLLRDTLQLLSPGDRLLVYFSGHGHGVRGEHVLLCQGARRKTLEFFDDAIPVEQIRRETDGLGLERSAIVDSCWDSLYVASTKGSSIPIPLSAEQTKYLRDIGTAAITPSVNGTIGSFGVLCGCGQDQVAVEIPRLRRGLFTLALMNVMKAAAAAQRELRLTDELCEAVAGEMQALGRANDLPIIPVPWKSGGGSAAVIVEGRAAMVRSELVFATSPSAAGVARAVPLGPLLKCFTNTLGMKLVYIPAGEFDMGSPVNEAGRSDDEMLHHVKITKPFMLATTTVTQGQWKAVMGGNSEQVQGG